MTDQTNQTDHAPRPWTAVRIGEGMSTFLCDLRDAAGHTIADCLHEPDALLIVAAVNAYKPAEAADGQ